MVVSSVSGHRAMQAAFELGHSLNRPIKIRHRHKDFTPGEDGCTNRPDHAQRNIAPTLAFNLPVLKDVSPRTKPRFRAFSGQPKSRDQTGRNGSLNRYAPPGDHWLMHTRQRIPTPGRQKSRPQNQGPVHPRIIRADGQEICRKWTESRPKQPAYVSPVKQRKQW